MTLEHRHHSRCACGSAFSAYREGASAGAFARPFALSGVARVYERPRPFSIQHIGLAVHLEMERKGFRAVATLHVTRVDPAATEIALDAVGFDLQSVEARTGGAPYVAATHVYDGETLRVAIAAHGGAVGDKHEIRVTYRAVPRRGMYFLAPDEHVPNRPRQVWTQCQDEDARHIFPCHDKPHVKQTTEVHVHAPAGYYVLSNGELVSESTRDDGTTFHWKMNEPHASYLFTLVAGEFARIDDEVDGVPLSYLVPKGREADGRRTFGRTPAMIRGFGERLGVRYPWNKYAQVVVSDFIFGGMENTTATTMYEHCLLDERASLDISSDDLISHELAHQWFGDLVTCRDWSHAWLNEGFATFMEHVDRESHKGRDEYDYGVRGDVSTYLSEARGRYRRPIVCQDYEAPIDIFDRHLYEKGGLVLHMLRRELGDDLFFSGVRLYLQRHAKGVVETRDLMRALEEVSGRSLERFFEQWVYRAGHPELDVKIEHEGELLVVTVKQTQAANHHPPGAPSSAPEPATHLFAFDLAIDIGLGNEVRREVRHVDQASQVFAIRVPSRPRFVVIDPEHAVLADVRLEAPGDMLRAQLREAPTARGRMAAASSLGRLDDPPTATALTASLADEKEFWGVRVEVADALGALRSEEAFTALEAAASTAHPKVRRAVAHALGSYRTAKAAAVLAKLALSDPSYLVVADAARALGATRQPIAFDTLVDILDRPSWADVIRAGAIDGLANLRDERALPHVVARTRYGVSTRGRRAAILAVPRLAADKKARETLEDLLDGADPHLRVDVVRALADLGDAKARSALHRQLDRELDGRVRRRIREALRDLGGSSKRETDRLRDELETVRAENASIKARLGKLEAAASPKALEGQAASTAKSGAPVATKKSSGVAVTKPKATATKRGGKKK